MAGQIRTRPLGGTITSDDTTVGTASAELLAANGARRALFVQNRSASANVFISCGSSATEDDIKLAAGEGLNFAALGVVPTNAVNIIADAADTPVAYMVG